MLWWLQGCFVRAVTRLSRWKVNLPGHVWRNKFTKGIENKLPWQPNVKMVCVIPAVSRLHSCGSANALPVLEPGSKWINNKCSSELWPYGECIDMNGSWLCTHSKNTLQNRLTCYKLIQNKLYSPTSSALCLTFPCVLEVNSVLLTILLGE